MKGLYHDPIMRFRAHEYEETAYLRTPVEAVNPASNEDHSLADGEKFSDSPVATAQSDEQLGLTARRRQLPPGWRVISGGRRERESLAAEQQSEPGWPLVVEVSIEGAPPAQLKFNRLGFDLVVECLGPRELSEILLRLEKPAQEIHMSPGEIRSLGPLKEFHLSAKSSVDGIIDALKTAGLTSLIYLNPK